MTTGIVAWQAARIAGLTCFGVIALSVLLGTAIRTGYLSRIAHNRSVIAAHGFLAWFWVPLGLMHVVALLLDASAQVHLIDLVIPFRVSYAAGAALAVGLGTVTLLVMALVAVTTLFRRHMNQSLWRWCHRLTYPMLIVLLLHAQLAGTDFSHAALSTAAWAVVAAILVLALPRLGQARMQEGESDVV